MRNLPSLSALSLLLLLPLLPAALRGADVPSQAASVEVAGARVEPTGCFTLDNVQFYLQHNDGAWARTIQTASVMDSSKTVDGATIYEGSLAVGASKLKFEETIKPADKNQFTITYKVTLPPDLKTNVLALAFELSVEGTKGKTFTYDGQSLVFPETMDMEKWQLVATKVSEITVPTQIGTITIKGNFACIVQDKRKWKKDLFEVHCSFPNGQVNAESTGGTVRELVLDVTFKSL